MPPREPGWWYQPTQGWQARVLGPFAWLYGMTAQRRFKRSAAYSARLPVICVGNFTAGGTGKTPLALAVAGIIRDLGGDPVFLSRGYGGRIAGPHRIDPDRDRAREVGDEPLLLARCAPTVVARDRADGARFIEASATPRTAIIMDDGLQNPALAKSLSLALVDARRGIGNGAVVPAGPLRAPLAFQLGLASAIIRVGQRGGGGVATPFAGFEGPVLQAAVQPLGDTSWLNGAKVVAYAGIANPGRFFTLLESLGANIRARIDFPDHHAFGSDDGRRLLQAALSFGALLVTTEKDMVRLAGADDVALQELRVKSMAVAIRTVFEKNDKERLKRLIGDALAGAWR